MRYLGVPLIAGRLSSKDCTSIVDKIKQRLTGWKTRPLSFAGQLTLLKSILQSYYIYWAGMFGLPRKQVESIFAKFLWRSPELAKNIHEVRWDEICKPLDERRLNIRRVKDMNNA